MSMFALRSVVPFLLGLTFLPQIVVTADFVSPSEDCTFDARGPSQVGIQELLTVTDPERSDRPVPITVWYPAINNGEPLFFYQNLYPSFGAIASPQVATPESNSHPLLIFSHGGFATRIGSASLMEHLASWGFVVAAPSHAGDSIDPEVFEPDVIPIYPYVFADRAKDITVTIDTLLNDPTFLVNPTEGDPVIGMLGESFGGTTAAVTPASESRIKATMSISPLGSELATENLNTPGDSLSKNELGNALREIDFQFLVMGGQNDTFVPIDPNNGLIYRRARNASQRWNLVLKNAGHTSFSDFCIFVPIIEQVLCGQLPDQLKETCLLTALGGPGGPEEGRRRLNEGICDVTLSTTLPLQRYAAASFFRSSLLRKKDAKVGQKCLKKLKNAGDDDGKYLAKYLFRRPR